MEQIATATEYRPAGGGRIASDQLRQSIATCEAFEGLDHETNHYDLLLLVKKLGRAAGFTPRMIVLLDYYFAFTRPVDWEEGSRPIVYQSISKTALDLGVTERQIQKLEKALFDVGAITWNDSGNHKRYGQRDPRTGRLRFAFGVELTPLAALKEELQAKLHEKQCHDAAWMELKRQISWYRSQIRAHLAEWAEEGSRDQVQTFELRYEQIAARIRTNVKLGELQSLLLAHKCLHSELVQAMRPEEPKINQTFQRASIPQEPQKGSSRDEPNDVHSQSTTQEPFNELNTGSPTGSSIQGSEEGRPLPPDCQQSFGLCHVTIGMATNAASDRFRALLPPDPNWLDVNEAAYRLRRDLRISQQVWGDACQLLGRSGAALCLLITDQAALRPEKPVRHPPAYFRAMLNRAKSGELQIHRSIFGLLRRGHANESWNQ
ncbi:MAG: plasmid replication protein RepC [Planctomycetota bacterium]